VFFFFKWAPKIVKASGSTKPGSTPGYAAYAGSCLMIFQDSLLVPPSRLSCPCKNLHNQQVCWCAHKTLPVNPILAHLNTVQTHIHFPSKIHFNSTVLFMPTSPNRYFPLHFPTDFGIHFLSLPIQLIFLF